MSLSSDQISHQATKILDEVHNRQDVDADFNKMDLRDQYRVTLAMKHMNAQYEADHPDLPRVHIDTFQDGQLKELDVKGRLWGWNSCYSRDTDPGLPGCADGGFKAIVNCFKEIGDK